MATVGDIHRVLARHYPSSLTESWDSSGVICGNWQMRVGKVLLAVDITAEILDEARDTGAQCIVSHHPLMLPRHSIAVDPWKFRLVARANTLNIALINAHTNADNARPGVTDALCDALRLEDTDAIIATHMDAVTGTGRIGNLSTPMSLDQLIRLIDAVVPGGRPRTNGNQDQFVSRIAVCAGAGDALLADVRHTDADVYITSDLRHHPVLEHVEAGGCTLIDIEHSAAEALWLPQVAGIVSSEAGVEVSLSRVSTAAWSDVSLRRE